jgi:hypothetical protein
MIWGFEPISPIWRSVGGKSFSKYIYFGRRTYGDGSRLISSLFLSWACGNNRRALSYAATSHGSRRSKHVRRDDFDMKCLQRLYRCCPAIATSWARHRAMDVRCPRPEESDHAAREIHGHRLHGLAYLEAECGIGIHRHRDNQEIFLALRRRYCGGRLKPVSPDVSTGFEIRTMTAGSFSLLKPRALHALFNVTDEDISLLMFGGYD